MLLSGIPHNIICRTEYFLGENITFIWSLGQEELSGVNLCTTQYPNNTATYSIKLDHNFNHCKTNHLSCTVHVHNELLGGDSYSVSTDLDLGRKWFTDSTCE